MASVRDIPTIPGQLIAKFQTGFYADPVNAVFKALGVQRKAASKIRKILMANSFLLRFQENQGNSGVQLASGTKTFTNIRTEQADPDPQGSSFNALPDCMRRAQNQMPQILAGTNTITEVRTESSDTDPAKIQFDSLPKE